ncbi:glycosyltransferase [Vibrio cholerae]
MGKVRVLVAIEAVIPSLFIDIINPLKEISQKMDFDVRIDYVSKINHTIIPSFDVIIFCRNQSRRSYEILLEAKKNGIFVVYDIDDNFFTIPTNTAIGRYHNFSERLFVTDMFISMSDCVTIYSRVFFEFLKTKSEKVKLLNTYFDLNLLNSKEKEKEKEKEKIKIAYASGRSPSRDIDECVEHALLDISNEFGDSIEIHYWRELPDILKSKNNVVRNPLVISYDEFVTTFNENEYAIGLAPLIEDDFFSCKTNNKYREYGACKTAGIYSNVKLYKFCIQNDKNGLLVDNTKEAWYGAIKKLINDHELRLSIAQNAYEDIKLNYSLDSSIVAWKEIIESRCIKQKNVLLNVFRYEFRNDCISINIYSKSHVSLYSEMLIKSLFNKASYSDSSLNGWNANIVYCYISDTGFNDFTRDFDSFYNGQMLLLDISCLKDNKRIEFIIEKVQCLKNIELIFSEELLNCSWSFGENSGEYLACAIKHTLLNKMSFCFKEKNKLSKFIWFLIGLNTRLKHLFSNAINLQQRVKNKIKADFALKNINKDFRG